MRTLRVVSAIVLDFLQQRDELRRRLGQRRVRLQAPKDQSRGARQRRERRRQIVPDDEGGRQLLAGGRLYRFRHPVNELPGVERAFLDDTAQTGHVLLESRARPRGEADRVVGGEHQRAAGPQGPRALAQGHERVVLGPEEHRAVETESGGERSGVQRQRAQVPADQPCTRGVRLRLGEPRRRESSRRLEEDAIPGAHPPRAAAFGAEGESTHSSAQRLIAPNTRPNARPFFVRRYSARMTGRAVTRLSTMPSSSSSLSRSESILSPITSTLAESWL